MAGIQTVDTLIFEFKVDDKLSPQLDKIDKKLTKVQKNTHKLDLTIVKAMKSIAKAMLNLAKTGVKVLVKSITDAFNAARKFQDQILQSHQAMKLSGEAARKFDQSIRSLAIEIGGIPLSNIADITNTAAILGLRGTENIKTFTTAIGQLATATDLSARVAAAKIPAILTVFGIATKRMGVETRKLADMITHLGFNFNATQSQILEVMATLSGAAVTSKLTMEEFAALATTVASVEKRFHTGGAAIQRILQRMASKSQEYAQLLGLNFKKFAAAIEGRPLEALKMVFNALLRIQQGVDGVQRVNQTLKDMQISGVRAGGVLLKMTQQINNLDSAMAVASSSANALQDAFDTAMGTFSKQWQSLLNIINEIRIQFGQPLLDAITRVLQNAVIPFLKRLLEWRTGVSTLGKAWEKLIVILEEKFYELWPVITAAATDFFSWMDKRINDFVTDIKTNGIRQAFLNVWETVKQDALNVFEVLGSRLRTWWDQQFAKISQTFGQEIAKQIDTILTAGKAALQLFSILATKAIENLKQQIGDLLAVVVPVLQGIAKILQDIDKWSWRLRHATGMKQPTITSETFLPGMEQELLKGGAAADVVKEKFDLIRKSIRGVEREGDVMADNFYRNSILPDISKWLQKNRNDVIALDRVIAQLNQRLQTMRQAAAQASGTSLVRNNVNMVGLQRSLREAEFAKAAATSIDRQDPVQAQAALSGDAPTGTGGGMVHVSFQGTNIIDDSSKDRFVRTLVSDFQNLREHVVYA